MVKYYFGNEVASFVTYFLFTNMVLLTNDDKVLIKSLKLEIGWSALRMMREFPSRKWKRSTLCDLIKRIDETVRNAPENR